MSSAYNIGIHHGTWAAAYLAGVLTVLVALAAVGATVFVAARTAQRFIQPRLDIVRNRS